MRNWAILLTVAFAAVLVSEYPALSQNTNQGSATPQAAQPHDSGPTAGDSKNFSNIRVLKDIPEDQLLKIINLALAKEWPYRNIPCKVEALKRSHTCGPNWEVDSTSVSGPDLKHVAECEAKRQRVLDELMPKYDVHWPEDQ